MHGAHGLSAVSLHTLRAKGIQIDHERKHAKVQNESLLSYTIVSLDEVDVVDSNSLLVALTWIESVFGAVE